MGVGLTEIKINSLLKLFNEKNSSYLELILTADKENNTVRGYAINCKSCEEVSYFVSLLLIKGLKAQYIAPDSFIVTVK